MANADRYPLRSWQRWSLLAACVGAGACVVLCMNNLHLLWQPYLYGYLACWLVAIGGLGLTALGNLTGGQWYAAARPFYLAAAQTMPLVAILFVPIAAFAEHIYPWVTATPGAMAASKQTYLETGFFSLRAVVYFAVWLLLSWLLGFVSRSDLPPASTPGMRRLGAIGLVLLVPTATFAAFDWGMSLEPEWYSSIYGALASAGGVLAVHALAICGLARIGYESVDAILILAGVRAESRHERPGVGLETSETTGMRSNSEHIADLFNDLGSLLLAFLMVWAYFSLSQFLLIWSANLPSEITWYMRRLEGGWEWMAIAIVVLHFIVPFMFLLSRENKRDPRWLATIAAWLIAMFLVHVYWMIVPAHSYETIARHVASVGALALLFGIWLAAYVWLANRALRRITTSDVAVP